MDSRQLRYFSAIVAHRGYGAAADALFVTQPTLSQAMAALEAELGAKLFERSGRRVVLSPAGRQFLGAVKVLEASLGDLEDQAQRLERLEIGQLTVATYAEFGAHPLAAMIGSFRQHHPGVTVTVLALTGHQDLVRALTRGSAELAVAPVAMSSPLGIRLVRPLGRRTYVAAMPVSASRRSAGPVTPMELLDHHLVLGPDGTPGRTVVDGFLKGHRPRSAREFPQDDRLSHAVAAGLGVAVLSVEAARSLVARRAGHVHELAGNPGLRFGMFARDGQLPPAARELVSLAGRTHRRLLREDGPRRGRARTGTSTHRSDR